MGRQEVFGKMEDILKLSLKMELGMEKVLAIMRVGRYQMNATMSMGNSMEKVFAIMRVGR